jgi:hypothetical protein
MGTRINRANLNIPGNLALSNALEEPLEDRKKRYITKILVKIGARRTAIDERRTIASTRNNITKTVAPTGGILLEATLINSFEEIAMQSALEMDKRIFARERSIPTKS